MDVVLLILTTLSLAAAAGFGALSWRVGLEERERSRARIAALSTAMDPPPLLAETAAAQARSRDDIEPRIAVGSGVKRFVVVGAMAVAVVIGAVVMLRSHAPAPAAAANASAPLELMSMRYQHDATTLTVSGLVRNPAGGTRVNGMTAVVFAFDRNGGFLASGRAPLDFSALAPGDESPFVVTVANVSGVARYRVSFRTDAGVVRHVDRRTAPVLAQR